VKFEEEIQTNCPVTDGYLRFWANNDFNNFGEINKQPFHAVECRL